MDIKLEQRVIESDSYEHTYKTLGELFSLSENQVRHLFRKNKIKKKTTKGKTASDLSEEDLSYFYENYNNYSFSYFEKKFNITEKILRKLLKDKNLTKKRITTFKDKDDWTEEQLSLLKNNYLDLTIQDLSELIGKSERAVSKKKWSLKLVSEKSWTQKEDELLKKYSYLPYDSLAFLLERSIKGVKHRCSLLKIKRSTPQETSIELIIKEVLDSISVSYVYNDILPKSDFNFRPDFRIDSHNIIIEVHGDYLHANPNKYDYEDLTDNQKVKHDKDVFKKEYYESLGYDVFIIWEEDLTESLEQTIIFIKSLFA